MVKEPLTFSQTGFILYFYEWAQWILLILMWLVNEVPVMTNEYTIACHSSNHVII